MVEVRELSDPAPTFFQNSSAWKRNLSVDEYVDMEMDLNDFVPSRYWAVFEGDTMVSSCRAWVRLAVLNGARGIEACIGNVFTGEEFRGKGYANILLKHVTAVLVAECDVVTLWSEIGEDYYTQFGYKLHENQEMITIDVDKTAKWPQDVSSMNSTHVNEMGQLHTRALESKLGPGEIATSAESPIYEMWIRQCIIKSSSSGVSVPDLWGAKYQDSWCTWTYDVRSGSLAILAMSGPDVRPLIAAAQHSAAKLNLNKIEVYANSLIGSSSSDLGGEVKPCDGSLSMYISKLKLVYPGKYAWF